MLSQEQIIALTEMGILHVPTPSRSNAPTLSRREHFYHCITVPIPDTNGNVVGMYGRAVPHPETGRLYSYPHLYLRGEHKGVINHEAVHCNPHYAYADACIGADTESGNETR